MIWLGLGAALSAAARQDREEEKRGLEERALSLELLVLGFVASRRALAELLETQIAPQLPPRPSDTFEFNLQVSPESLPDSSE